MAVILHITAAFAQAQSSFDPPTYQTFSQATTGMTLVDSYSFGTASGNITSLSQLAANFNPYGIAKLIVINEEWERYQKFNATNFFFEANSLDLTASIPASGGLYPGGINSGQIWSKHTYQPGKTGHNAYAMSARIKIPGGTGMWPAFWLFSPLAGDMSEVDICEFLVMNGESQYDWTGHNHGPGVGPTFYSNLTSDYAWHPGTDFSGDFHDYQFIWTPDATYKYVDGQLILAQYFQWTSNQPAQIGINLAVGSNEYNLPGLRPYGLSEFPSAVQVQSLTVWGDSNSATAPAPADPVPTAPTPSASASYAGLDTTSQGKWTGTFGADGYAIANGANSLPSYAVMTLTGPSTFTWGAQTYDNRALQTSPGAMIGIASSYYAAGSFRIDLNLTDGNAHRIALYLLDWDNSGRSETISVLDAGTSTVLDTQNFSGFGNGQYAAWDLKGHVIIQVTALNNGTACVSGIFFGSGGMTAAGPANVPAAASFSGVDTTSQGIWTGRYGGDGYAIANDATSLPSYATADLSEAKTFTWGERTTDPRALQRAPGAGSGIASTYYADGAFSINLNLNDGNEHRVAFYLLDWDNNRLAETISIVDAASNAVLDTQTFSGLGNGVYAVWNVKGAVRVQVKAVIFGSAAVSGIFFN